MSSGTGSDSPSYAPDASAGSETSLFMLQTPTSVSEDDGYDVPDELEELFGASLPVLAALVAMAPALAAVCLFGLVRALTPLLHQ